MSRWGRQGLRAGGLLCLLVRSSHQCCLAHVHSGKAVSPFLQLLGPDILLSGLGEAQNLMPSAFGQRGEFGWGFRRSVPQVGRDPFSHGHAVFSEF